MLEGRGEKTVTESELRVILGKGVRGNRENKGREEHVGRKWASLGISAEGGQGRILKPESGWNYTAHVECKAQAVFKVPDRPT